MKIGDSIELMLPSGSKMLTLDNMEDADGKHMEIAKGSGYIAHIRFEGVSVQDMRHGLLIRHFKEGEISGLAGAVQHCGA